MRTSFVRSFFPCTLAVLLLAACGGGSDTADEPTTLATQLSTTEAPTTTAEEQTTTTTAPATTTTEPGPEAVSLTDVGDHLGETTEVCGEAFAQINRLNDKLLNLEDEVTVWFPDLGTATAALERDGVDSYYTESVCVTGEIVEGDGGFFAIVVEDVEQIELGS